MVLDGIANLEQIIADDKDGTFANITQLQNLVKTFLFYNKNANYLIVDRVKYETQSIKITG